MGVLVAEKHGCVVFVVDFVDVFVDEGDVHYYVGEVKGYVFDVGAEGYLPK